MAGTFNQSLQCTQDVFIGFQAPLPPVLGNGGLVEDLPQRVDMAESSIPVDMSCPVYNTTFYLSHHLVLCYQPREESTRSHDMVAGEAGDSEGETTCPF